MLLKIKKNTNEISGQLEIIEDEKNNVLQFNITLITKNIDFITPNFFAKEQKLAVPTKYTYFVEVGSDYWDLRKWRKDQELSFPGVMIIPTTKLCGGVKANYFLPGGVRGEVLVASYGVKPIYWRIDIDYTNKAGESVRLRFVK